MYKVGDAVMIKTDLKVGGRYDGMNVVEGMRKYFGQIATIIGVCGVVEEGIVDYYKLDIDGDEHGSTGNGWKWTEKMLIPYDPSSSDFDESDMPISFLLS